MLRQVTEGLLLGMKDASIPVRTSAACSLRVMIDAEEIAELLKPIIPQIVEEYFRIMEEVDSDSVLSALQVIVTQFGKEITDMAPAMVGHLLQIFANSSSAGEDDDEAVFTATQCLDTITAVMDVSMSYMHVSMIV